MLILKNVSPTAAIVLVVGLIACHDGTPPVAAPLAVAQSSVRTNVIPAAQLGVPKNVRPEEAWFAELSTLAPSAAGFYFDSAGRLVARVRDGANDLAALAHLRNFVMSGRLRGAVGRSLAAWSPSYAVVRADYTFRQLAEYRDAAFDNVLGKVSGVYTLDLDEAQNRVTIGIAKETFAVTRAAVMTKLSALAVDTSAIAFRVTGPAVADSRFTPPTQIDQQTSDPLAGGLIIDLDSDGNGSYAGTCTLGFTGKRNSVLGLVTASHCTSQIFNPDADRVYQRFGGPWVATMSVDPDAYGCSVQRCRGADAAFATAVGANMAVGKIIRTQSSNGGSYGGGFGTLTVNQSQPYFTIISGENQIGELILGQRVEKIGITTGWTWGNIAGTCADGYIAQNGAINVIRCEYEADYVADHGDSGGPVFMIEPQGNGLEVILVGIHSNREAAGSRARFSKLSRIMSDLGGTWEVTGGPGSLRGTLEGPTTVRASSMCSFQYIAFINGGAGGYSYNWSTSGTITQNNGSSILATFPTAGSYWVAVTVTDLAGTAISRALFLTSSTSSETCEA